MSVAIRLAVEPVRSLAAASIDAGYMGIGTAFTKPVRILFVQNLTDEDVMISFNGVDDHFPLATNGFILLDVTSNKTIPLGYFIAEGTRMYVKQLGVPTTGSVYVTTFYAAE